MGQPVAVIASGIGPGTAALCLMEILQCRYDESRFMTYQTESIARKAFCAKHAVSDAVVSHLAWSNLWQCWRADVSRTLKGHFMDSFHLSLL